MKALSVKEPWASMLLRGEKTIETRTWPTSYRGDLLLVASQRPSSPIAGQAYAIVDLYFCRPMTGADVVEARGEFYPGAWAWGLRHLRPITPFPVRGMLGLYEVNVTDRWELPVLP